MVTVLDDVICKQATMIKLPQEKPAITGRPGHETINYAYIAVPKGLNRALLSKAGLQVREKGIAVTEDFAAELIENASEKRNLYLRIADKRPLSIVTDKFTEISPRELKQKSDKIIGEQPTIRYFANNESLQLNYKIDSKLKGFHIAVNSGSYGVYGGSGKNAAHYAITYCNPASSTWTFFPGSSLDEKLGRIIHIDKGEELLLKNICSFVDEISGKLEDSKNYFLKPEVLLFAMESYSKRSLGKTISSRILAENPKGMTAYSLSDRILQISSNARLSDTTKFGIETLAGDIILNHDEIPEMELKAHSYSKSDRNERTLKYVPIFAK